MFKTNNKMKNKYLMLNIKYFILQVIPISIMIFIQFYQFRVVSVEKQMEVIRRVTEMKMVNSFNDLNKINIKCEDDILNNPNEDFLFVTSYDSIEKTSKTIEPYMSFTSSNSILFSENIINVIDKNLDYKDDEIKNIINHQIIDDKNFNFIVDVTNNNNIIIYQVFESNNNYFIISNRLKIENFSINVVELKSPKEELEQFFFQKQFQIVLNDIININETFLFSLNYNNFKSLNMYIYLFIFTFFQLFWTFSGRFFGIKRLLSNDTQKLESFIEISMDRKFELIKSKDDLQFPELFELGKKINGVSQIYSKLYREMSNNKKEIQTMINNIPEQIFKIDKDFNIINANNVQTSLTEYFQYELNNSKFFNLIEDNESKNKLFRSMYDIYNKRKKYFQYPDDEEKNENLIDKIGQLQYQDFNLVEKITNTSQNKYQNFEIVGLKIKLKTKSGNNLDVKCNVSCINENEFIVSLKDISYEMIQQEKVNTLYNLQIELIKTDNININNLLLRFQYMVKQDSQYLLKIEGDKVNVEYGVVTDDKFKGLIEHQDDLKINELKDVQEILDYNEELFITDISSLKNKYLKDLLTNSGINTCLQFKIENKEYDILYSFCIDYQSRNISENELYETQELQRLFKNIILNYLIQKKTIDVSKTINETNNQILNNIFDFIYQIDENHKIIFANNKVQDSLNKDVEELLFKNFTEQLEINDFYKDKIIKDMDSIFENKMKVIEDSQFVLGNIVFRGTILKKYQEIMGRPQVIVNFKQHQDISDSDSMNKLINRKTLFIDDIMLKINNRGIILKQFIPFGQNYELLKIFKKSNGKNILKIFNENIKNKDTQISLNSKIQELLDGEILTDFEKVIQIESNFNINDIEHLKLKIIFNRQTDNNINIIIQTKL